MVKLLRLLKGENWTPSDIFEAAKISPYLVTAGFIVPELTKIFVLILLLHSAYSLDMTSLKSWTL